MSDGWFEMRAMTDGRQMIAIAGTACHVKDAFSTSRNVGSKCVSMTWRARFVSP